MTTFARKMSRNPASEAKTSLCINITQMLLVTRRSVCSDVLLKMQLQYINGCDAIHTFGSLHRQTREEGIEWIKGSPRLHLLSQPFGTEIALATGQSLYRLTIAFVCLNKQTPKLHIWSRGSCLESTVQQSSFASVFDSKFDATLFVQLQ